MINIFIGYDAGEKIAYHVLSQSIIKYSSGPVRITPLYLPNLQNIFFREKVPNQSTEFAFSRFLVPHLSNFEGWSVFMDCDMMLRTDIQELNSLYDSKYAVQVCKHNYVPRQNVKFRGAKNEAFPKKNWTSFMITNNSKCKELSLQYVHDATGLELHQLKWINEQSIGELPQEWNWLVGEYDYNEKAKNVHFTLGGPYFTDYKNCDYSDEWFEIYKETVKIDL